MNQDNNYNFDPMTGQPINSQSTQQPMNSQSTQQPMNSQSTQQSMNYQPFQQPIQSPVQPQMNTGYVQQPIQTPPPTKNKKPIIVIIILVIIGIIIFILVLNNQDKNPTSNNEFDNMNQDNDINYEKNDSFLFEIGNNITTNDRGVQVYGQIINGRIKVGDIIGLVELDKENASYKKLVSTEVIEIEKSGSTAIAGDYVTLLLKDITENQITSKHFLKEANSIIKPTKFVADIHMLSKAEGGRHTPIFSNYSSSVYFESNEIKGIITLPEGTEMIMPGDDTSIIVTLLLDFQLKVGDKFSIKEGGKTIAKGTITRVYKK